MARRKGDSVEHNPMNAISITSAQESLTVDQSGRMKRYFISMMIRTACFVSAVFLPNPFRWFALIGAVTLPYIAVVIANAGREVSPRSSAFISDAKREIE